MANRSSENCKKYVKNEGFLQVLVVETECKVNAGYHVMFKFPRMYNSGEKNVKK